MMQPQREPVNDVARAEVLTKAVLRAATHLKITNRALGKTLGVSESTISRLQTGAKILEPKSKPFEIGALFVRLYRGLDAIVGGDDTVSAQWLKNNNKVLGGRPLDMIQSLEGLVNVIQYVDARRAVI